METQTGDPRFDRRFYIDAEDPEFARRFWMNQQNRGAAHSLFDLGISELTLNETSLEIFIKPFPGKSNPDPEKFAQALRLLTSNMPSPGAKPVAPPLLSLGTRRRLVAGSVISAFAGFAFLLAVFDLYPPLDRLALFLFTLRFVAPAFLVFIIVVFVYLRGRSSSHRDIILIFVFSLMGFAQLGFGLTLLANGALDDGEVEAHEAWVVSKRKSRQDSATRYYVKMRSWRNKGETEEIRVYKNDFDRITKGSARLEVYTKPGYLGFEYVTAYRISAL